MQQLQRVVSETGFRWQGCEPVEMVKKFFSGVLHVEKISLNKLQQIPVIEARWHFNVFVFSKPLFNVGNSLKFVLSDVVPAKKHCSFVVVALNID